MGTREPDPISQAIGQVIKRHRGGRTQAAIAAEAGIGSSVWSLYESGQRRPRPDKLERIAEVLQLSVKEIWLEAARNLLRSHGQDSQLSGPLTPTGARKEELAQHLDDWLQGQHQSAEALHALGKKLLGLEE